MRCRSRACGGWWRTAWWLMLLGGAVGLWGYRLSEGEAFSYAAPPPAADLPAVAADLPAEVSSGQQLTAWETESEPGELSDADLRRLDELRQAGLPPWVDSPPVRTGDRHLTPVSSDYCATHQEARQDLDLKLKAAADQYVDWLLGRRGAAAYVGFSLGEIKRRLVVSDEPLVQEREFAQIGRMYRTHALLQVDPGTRSQIHHRWENFVSASRLGQTGLIAAGVFGCLVLAFSYFKLNAATRGFYAGRLQFFTATVILGMLAVGAYFARFWIPWV